MVTCEATPSSAARASIAARSAATTPPVSANTVWTDQPCSWRYGTQKEVSSTPLKARTMSREEPGVGNGEWRMEGSVLMEASRGMGGLDHCSREANSFPSFPIPLIPGRWRSQRRHHRLLHMQPVLRLVDVDAARGVHHPVGGLDVSAQRQAVAECRVVGQRHL